MKIIIVSQKSNKHRQWHLNKNSLLIAASLLVSTVILSFWLLYYQLTTFNRVDLLSMVTEDERAAEMAAVRSYYTERLGGLQAETIRIKALVEKLVTMNGMDIIQYDLDEKVPQGGIDKLGISLTADEFNQHASQLETTLTKQSAQIMMLRDYLITEDSIESTIPSGKPIKDGWISSYYGYRIDPFNGKKAFHHGLDFAGEAGSGVYAIADGIVKWAGRRSGYGKLVEIDHGNGYITRYAHNAELKVANDDRVKKGQQVALMGSTGRSTGPHVHLEVLLNDRRVNPYNFVK